MVNNSWIADLQTSIFSRLKAIGMTKLKIKYPNINFTTIPIDVKNATFPTIYVHELTPVETNPDLEGEIINSINYAIQIEVFANDTNRTDAKLISYTLMDIMKSMCFEGESLPLTEYGSSVTRCIARYRRNISLGDII